MITAPWEGFRNIEPPPGYDVPIAVVHVHNEGRMSATVTGWSVGYGALRLAQVQMVGNKATPYRLEDGDEIEWWAPLSEVMAVATAANKTGIKSDGMFYAQVSLGSGKTVRSTKHYAP